MELNQLRNEMFPKNDEQTIKRDPKPRTQKRVAIQLSDPTKEI